MKKANFQIIILVIIFSGFYSCIPERQKQESNSKKIEHLISQLTLEQKIKMLSGTGFDTPGIDSFNIPGLRMTDGPAGVRWGKSTAFPAPISYAASWDNNLINRIGSAMAEEVKLKNKNVLLAPCVNIHRFPLGGRNFESYGEDPFLAGKTAVSFIKGVQSRNVVATVKHFAANNQEWERFRVNTVVGERALREIYLPAFKAAVQEAGVYSVMAAYNKVNGHYCSANRHLLTDILKNEWGFNGYIVSDWGATHNTVEAANSGLDIEMPYGKHFGDSLLLAVKNKKVSEATIDDKVRRILSVMFRAGLTDTLHIDNTDTKKIYKNHRNLALEAAEKSMVLLKNSGILPLDKAMIKSVAVIGPNAAYAVSGGGGSSMVRPFYKISPMKGIQNFVGNEVTVYYASGPAMDGDILPVKSKYLFQIDKKNNGLKGEYFKLEDFTNKPVFTRIDKEVNFNFGYNAPESEMEALDDGNKYAIRWTGLLKAPVSGSYLLKVQCDGGVRLYIDKKLLFEDLDNKDVKLRTASVYLKKNTFHKIRIEYISSWGVSEVKFGWDIPGYDPVEEAVKTAKKADIAILITGLSNHFESESGDLKRFTFPGQDRFINAVATANRNTVVVMYNGSPYSMKEWAKNVPAILEAWYGGQEQGNALANILFGMVNPSGKLPFSIIADSTDCPAFADYKSSKLISEYSEGVFVGYRYLEKNGIKPLFPFGLGLSYTTFDYKHLKTKVKNSDLVDITLSIKNTGDREGSETVQIYVSQIQSSVERPLKELKGFKKITLQPDEEQTINFTLHKEAFAYFDENKNKWIVEPGKYIISAGSSSEDIRLKNEIKL